jgi:hypothetical protein
MEGKLLKIPAEGLFDENFGFTSMDRIERLIVRDSDTLDIDYLPPAHANWIPATRVAPGEGFFAIDAETATEKIWIKFFPENSEQGAYSITPKPTGRNRTELGKATKVIDLTDELIKKIIESRRHSNLRLHEIISYENRFLVETLTDQHPRKRLVWVIGLDKKSTPESTAT